MVDPEYRRRESGEAGGKKNSGGSRQNLSNGGTDNNSIFSRTTFLRIHKDVIKKVTKAGGTRLA